MNKTEFELKDREFSAFKNKFKEKSTDYDFFGDALIDDQEHWVNIWVNKDKNGSDYFNIKLKPKNPVVKKHVQLVNSDDKSEINTSHAEYEKATQYAKDQAADKLTESQQALMDAFDDDIPF
tara:strand:+ start:3331 stop:3696 length:366 start_codon:yes stop_codon:yes gene_type:complete